MDTTIAYPDGLSSTKFQQRVILTPSVPGELHECFSVDSAVVDDDTYPVDFLNSLTPSGVPPHILLLNRGAIVMLLKNLDLKAGLTNGSRLIIKIIFRHLLDVEILSGYHRGQRHYLPKMLFQPSDSGFPFVLKRLRFPIRLAFSMTNNKSQSQNFDNFGIFLDRPCFSHGQLYVTFSRAPAYTDIKVKLWGSHEQVYHNGKWYTRNVVIEYVLKTCAHPTNASSAAGIVQSLSNTQQESSVGSPNCISPASSVSFRSPIKSSLLVTPVGSTILRHFKHLVYQKQVLLNYIVICLIDFLTV